MDTIKPENQQPEQKKPEPARELQQSVQTPPPQRLSNAQRRERRKSFFSKVVAIFIFIVMVGWVFIYYVLPSDNSDGNQNGDMITVSGYNFYLMADGTFGTYTNIGGKQVPIAFRLDPRNASTITLDTSSAQQISSAKKLYITTDPNIADAAKMTVAAIEISRITGLYGIETIGAYTKDSSPPNPSVPIRTCKNVEEFTTVIELGVDNSTSTSITNDKGCIKISATDADELILASDKLGMNLIGIKL